MIRFGSDYAELAGIQYMGLPGISASCAKAVQLLLASDEKVTKALLLSASGSHAFLLNLGETDYEEWVAIKSGFSSGYIGEGPRTLSETLALLGAFDVSVEEVTVDPYLLQRLDQSALTIKDLEFVTHAPPIRPRRVYDYMADGDFGYANQSRALRRLNTAMPWGSLDSRLYDLAKSFENNPDHALMAGFRRLEETVRNRVGKDVSEAKVFASAFLGEKPCLTWVDITTAERISRGNLFVGAYGAFRNPRAHKELNQDRVTQLCEFMTLNLLFRLEATAIEFVGAKDNEAC